MAQKSWPSGAPTRAATASMAVMPGTMARSTARQAAVPGVDRLADRRGHGEDAGIAARHQRDTRAGGRMVEGGSGAAELLAVVGGVAALAGPLRHAVEIGSVAVEGVGLVERGLRFAGEEAVIAGTETDDREPPAHDGRSRAGTSTTAK